MVAASTEAAGKSGRSGERYTAHSTTNVIQVAGSRVQYLFPRVHVPRALLITGGLLAAMTTAALAPMQRVAHAPTVRRDGVRLDTVRCGHRPRSFAHGVRLRGAPMRCSSGSTARGPRAVAGSVVGRTPGDRTSRSGAAAARDASGRAISGHNHPDAAAKAQPRRAGPALPGIRRGPGYPRLANYNGLHDGGEVPFLAADDLIIARRGAPLRQLARAHPRALTLLYERTLQVDLCCVRDLYGLDPAAVPPGWWLTQAGSRLTGSIDAAQRWIPVAGEAGITHGP